MFRYTALSLLLALTTQAQDRESDLYGRVVGVSESDTFTLLVDKEEVKVRPEGTDYSIDAELAEAKENTKKNRRGLWRDPGLTPP